MVEPPIACSTTIALLNAPAERIASGRGPVRASAAAHVPEASASRRRSECTAGIVAAIGRLIPIASVMQAIVLAVPITMQVPAVGASLALTVSISS